MVDCMLAPFTTGSTLVLYCGNVVTATTQIHEAAVAAVILDRSLYSERVVHVVIDVEELNQR